MTIFSLYQYTNRENGKRYIGVTGDLSRRGNDHARGKSNALAFNSAVKKYGIWTFDFKVLAIFDRVDAAAYHEQAAILKFGTLFPNGYNLRAGAPWTKYIGTPSEETRKKMSRALRGRPSPFLGHHHTEETKKKMSEANMGNTKALGYRHSEESRRKISWTNCHRSEETRRKLSEASRSHHHSEATRKKLSAANMGHHPSEETREKISWASRHRSEETRKKMSEAHIGRHPSEATRKKMSIALIRWWERKNNK